MTFDELYKVGLKNIFGSEELPNNHDQTHLDCLLSPEKYPPVIKVQPCSACTSGQACIKSCIFDAIVLGENGEPTIDAQKCVGCAECVQACKSGKISFSRDALAALKEVRKEGAVSYAMIAPAFLGQFSAGVTPGRLRSAFKALGFTGMVEVALFADILTLKEALEFDKNIVKSGDYQLTSCCCPIWIAMIKKVYGRLISHLPGSVSPMVACGRVIKKLHPDAVTVFIGPCVAKKSEAREKDIAGAVDFVLTFQEMHDVFEAAGIKPQELDESEKDHSSKAGRIYARKGGVSEAVKTTLNRLNPDKKIQIKTKQADGVPACRAMIDELLRGNVSENFFEGMGCVGGCVGGPKAVLNKEQATVLVNDYADQASFLTPLDNPFVLELLKRLAFDKVEDLLGEDDLFTRKLNDQ